MMYNPKVQMPRAEHSKLLAGAKAAAAAEKKTALAEQERKYAQSLAEIQGRLDAASKNYASEAEQIKARIKELEVQVAAAQQKISECKDESLQKLMTAAERMAGLLKENREMYAKLNPKL